MPSRLGTPEKVTESSRLWSDSVADPCFLVDTTRGQNITLEKHHWVRLTVKTVSQNGNVSGFICANIGRRRLPAHVHSLSDWSFGQCFAPDTDMS